MNPNTLNRNDANERGGAVVCRRAVCACGLAGLLLLGASSSGCASANLARVKPWERATLTDYTMRPDRDPLYTAFTEHTYFSRETATGGRGVGGSGCGCN
jgi:Domain of unknown function (DUF4266)